MDDGVDAVELAIVRPWECHVVYDACLDGFAGEGLFEGVRMGFTAERGADCVSGVEQLCGDMASKEARCAGDLKGVSIR